MSSALNNLGQLDSSTDMVMTIALVVVINTLKVFFKRHYILVFSMFKRLLIFIYITLPVFTSVEFFSFETVNNLINSIKEMATPNQIIQNGSALGDTDLNFTQMVIKYKYEVKEHTVTSDDGYILTLHRMPARNLTNDVIILMHGILDSSDSWVLQGPKYALAYYLVDEGFDVWLGNARGNKYSLLHTTLNTSQAAFWKFSWDEIGCYDLPAIIDYVLNETGQNNLYYVGHSQGTTSFYVMNSLKPEYNSKIKKMFSLAPVSWMSHAKSPIVKMFTPAYNIVGYLNIDSYYTSTDYLNKFQQFFCNFLPIDCDHLLEMIIGNNNKLIEASLMPVILGHVPTSSSTIQLVHYAQLYSSGRFCRFDFGSSENLLKYGQEIPPEYNLINVTVPIVLFYSSNDWLSDTADVSLLSKALPNVYNSFYLDNFNHFDYMYASVAKDLVYSNIIKEIRYSELNINSLN